MSNKSRSNKFSKGVALVNFKLTFWFAAVVVCKLQIALLIDSHRILGEIFFSQNTLHAFPISFRIYLSCHGNFLFGNQRKDSDGK